MNKNLISIDEVCAIVNCSAPTIYRRIKDNKFPAAKKVPAIKVRGPRTIHRWDRKQVMKWLLEGNEKKWTKNRIAIGAYVDSESIIADAEQRIAPPVRHDIDWNMAAIASGLVCLIVYVYFLT